MEAATREQTIDVKEITAILLRRKWLLILPIVLVTALVFGGSYLLQPKYRSSTIVWIDKPSNVSRELIDIIGRERMGRETGEQQRRKLRALQNEITSQTYLFRLIEDLKLDQDPDICEQATRLHSGNLSLDLQQLRYDLLLPQLRQQISVAFVGADQIRLTVESNQARLSRDMVTRLTEILEQEKTRYELDKILDNQSFADMQLQKTEDDYQRSVDSLTAAQARLTRLQLPEATASETNLRDIQADIDHTRQEIDDYSAENDRLSRRLDQLRLSETNLLYSDTVVRLRSEIDRQIIALAAMMDKYSWSGQTVTNADIRVNDNIRFLERELFRLVDRQFSDQIDSHRELLRQYFAAREHLDLLETRRNRLRQALGRINERTAQVPRLQTEISELERRVEDTRKYRDAFRSEEAIVAILSERTRERTKYKIIEPARIPLQPFWPDRRKIAALGLLLGLIFGGAAVFLVEIFDHSFKRVEDVQQQLRMPVLATIPRIEKLTFRR